MCRFSLAVLLIAALSGESRADGIYQGNPPALTSPSLGARVHASRQERHAPGGPLVGADLLWSLVGWFATFEAGPVHLLPALVGWGEGVRRDAPAPRQWPWPWP